MTMPSRLIDDYTAHCSECGRPWGVILKRGQEPSDELRDLCQREMEAVWLEGAEDDVEQDEPVFDLSKLPRVSAVEVAHISLSLAKFISEHDFAEGDVEDGWQEIGNTGLPPWLLKNCPRRWAYRWDCCDLGWADNYLVDKAVAS